MFLPTLILFSAAALFSVSESCHEPREIYLDDDDFYFKMEKNEGGAVMQGINRRRRRRREAQEGDDDEGQGNQVQQESAWERIARIIKPSRDEADLLCRSDEDCPAYHCVCATNLHGGLSRRGHLIPCGRKGRDHLCKVGDAMNRGADFDLDSSTWMCFKMEGKSSWGACASAFLMPCDKQEDCPKNFRCETKAYASAAVQACQPKDNSNVGGRKRRKSDKKKCRDNFDCGYDGDADQWKTCDQDSNTCID